MSIPDKAMPSFFRLVTRWAPPEIEGMEKQLALGTLHPRDAKMRLSHEIVSSFYSEPEAVKAEEEFIRLFQKHDRPDEVEKYIFQPGQNVLDVMIATGLVASKSEGRRLLEQKGVRLDGEVLSEWQEEFPHPGLLQVGKRRFVEIQF